jgi:hypothetical protein
LTSSAVSGCAYFGFIGTDLVPGSFSQPSASGIRAQLPKFIGEPAPLSKAIDAIEKVGVGEEVSEEFVGR